MFQRTPNFSIPANNGAGARRASWRQSQADRAAYREAARWSRGGVPRRASTDERARGVATRSAAPRYEDGVAARRHHRVPRHATPTTSPNPTANELLAEFVRNKIRVDRERPGDGRGAVPEGLPDRHQAPVRRHRTTTRRTTCPTSASSTCASTRSPRSPRPASTLVDESFEFDAIVFATGFDAMTGAIVGVDITGRDGVDAEGDVGRTGPTTYLGLMAAGLPEPVHDHRPGQPVGAVEHGRCRSSSTSTGSPTASTDLRSRGLRARSSPPRPPSRRLGAARQRLRRHHAVSRRRTPGTWAPTCPASRGCSCPTSAASTATATTCDEVVDQRLPRLRARRARRGTAVQRRRHPPRAARRGDRARDDGRAGPAAARVDVGRRGARRSSTPRPAARPPGPDVGEIVDGVLPGAGRRPRLPPVPAGDARPAPDRRLLPRRRLGARQPRLRRPVLPRPVRAVRRDHRVGRLPPRPRGPLPGRGRRRASPPCSGSPTNADDARRRSRASWPWPAGAPAATSPPSSCQLARDAGGPAIVGSAAAHAGDRRRPRHRRRTSRTPTATC